MKIAMLTKHFNFRNGSSRAVHEISTRLANRGHEVHIFCNRGPNSYSGRPILRHVPMIPLGGWMKVLSFKRGCALRTGRERFDVIHGHGNTTIQSVVTVRVCRKANLLVRGLPLSLWDPHLWIESRQFRNPGLKRIITLSEMVKRDLVRHYGMRADRIVTIPNGVDASRFHPGLRAIHGGRVRRELGLAEQEYLVLFIASGNFINRGLMNLFTALMRCPTLKLKLLVAGGDRLVPYRARAREMGIEDRLVIRPFSERIEELYGVADALIFPSYYDTFGNVPLEAMACGLPVLVTAQCGMSELITDGHDGLILKHSEDIDGMASALAQLEDPVRRGRLGLAARAAAERCGWDAVAEKTMQVYEEIM